MAVAMRLVFDTLMASTCTLSLCDSELGTVYTAFAPLWVSVPIAGENDHVTPLVFAPLVTSVTAWEFVKFAEDGVISSAANRPITADTRLVVSAELVAVIVTGRGAGTMLGAT
jgi:hypothetical protein